MTKTIIGWLAVLLTALLFLLGWNTYVCDIKGFCGKGEKKRASYERIYNRGEKEEYEKKEKKQEYKNEETRIIREVFYRSSETELSEILDENGQRVVVALWKKEVRDTQVPISFEQFLTAYREDSPKKKEWEVRDFLPPSPEVPTYENGSPEMSENDFPSSEPKSMNTGDDQVPEQKSESQTEESSDEAESTETTEGAKESSIPGQPEPVVIEEKTAAFCPDYITVYIQVYADNDTAEVAKLERFLKEYEGYDIVVDGFYSLEDNDMVKQFQSRYAEDVLEPLGLTEPTGNVYAKTMQKINSIYCSR
jgi:hypothetical protein